MIEQKVRLLSEGLARSVNRRDFLRKAGTALFAGMAALAVGQLGAAKAAAGQVGQPDCAPPGPYCDTGGGPLSGCHGGSCYQHLEGGTVYPCRVFYAWYQAGCWTTYGGGGYWVCCDCECYNNQKQIVATCGCAQHSSKPDPRPDGPSGGKATL